MDYQLAKELKEAGFPQPRLDDHDYKGSFFNNFPASAEDLCYDPTLEELADACNRRGIKVITLADFTAFKRVGYTNVYSSRAPNEQIYYDGQDFPSALARLWLSLSPAPSSPPQTTA